ncbi:MAG: HD domain-containing protein [Clostridia bacterium]|nr:HD domain-containing protein [Clostridia bacterium]
MDITIAMLETGMRFEGFLLVRSADQREGKTGGKYLDMNLTDKTGEVNCKLWDGTVAPPPQGSVIKVRGLVQEYNGRKQLRVEKMRMSTEADGVDLSLLVPCAPEAPDAYRAEIERTIDAFASEDLKKIVREMLRMAGDNLEWFPAAQRLHHAERTGLLHHTCSMLRTAEHILQVYPFLHGDLLRAGVILHDLSKIDEMKSDTLGNVTDYTREGLLIGHLVRGVAKLAEAAKNVGVTGEIVVLLEHMIISHHGIPEYGSPKPPMFPEAEVLNWIDTLDARMNEMEGIMARVPAGAFSEKIWSLDRRMYHPHYEDGAE